MLVLKKFEVKKDDFNFLTISGREEGIVAWILALLGFDPTTTLTCNKEVVEFSMSGLKGQSYLNVPITAVTGVLTGIHKPIQLLIVAIVCLFGGIYMTNTVGIMALLGGIIGCALFFFLYKINKTMAFGVYYGGDYPIMLHIKKSVIEGVDVNSESFKEANELLNAAVLEVNKK